MLLQERLKDFLSYLNYDIISYPNGLELVSTGFMNYRLQVD